MPEQPLEGAARTAERIRRAVKDLQLRYPTPSGPQVPTISAGIALRGRSAAHDEDEVLRQADAELYRANEAGRKTGPRTSRSPPPPTILGEGSSAFENGPGSPTPAR